MELIKHTTQDPKDRDDMLSAFYGTLYSVWNCQSQIHETLDLPMPFQYFHIMNLMLMLNLLLWAYSLGCQDSWFAPVIYMFVQLMFQGLRELSTALSDPYGSDEVDFQINDWIVPLYTRMNAALGSYIEVDEVEIDHASHLMGPQEATTYMNMYIDKVMADREDEVQPQPRPKKKQRKQPVRQQIW